MAAWSEEMRAPLRRLRLGGRLVFGSGRELALTGDMVATLTIEEGSGGALEPGCVLSAICTLDLVNDSGQWNAGGSCLGQGVLAGATLMPRLGVVVGNEQIWHDLGVFQVESAAYMEGEAKLRLRAKDSISFELAEAFTDELSYPCALQTLWEHAVAQTPYVWTGEVPNGGAVVGAAPDWKGVSLRTALGYIAAAAGCFVRIGRSGDLELCPLWNADSALHEMDGESYLKLESGGADYGPVDALRLKCVNAEAEKLYTGEDGSALFTVSVSENPLFQEEAEGVDGLARGMLAELAGFKSEALSFEWRGDPALKIGDRLRICDRNGGIHEGVLTRQTLCISSGFSASCVCDIPQDNHSGVRRAITPEGGLNSAALVGAVNGALLSVGSVTTNKLAAGSITAEKLAAGAVDADALAAVTAKIGSLTADDIQTDRMAAELARITVLAAGTASFDKATVSHLVAQAMNLEYGVAGLVFIKNLAVEYAQMVGAAIGNLCIKASDGNYYRIDVKPDGTVSAVKTTVSAGEIAAGQTEGGRVILETNITAANLNAGNLLATYALVNKIDAARIDVDALFAREAFISALNTSKIFGGNSLEIIVGKANGAARIFRQEEFPDGTAEVKPGDMLVKPSTGQQYQAVQSGAIRFAMDADGGLYYEYDGDGSLIVDGFDLYANGFTLPVDERGEVTGVPYVWELVQDGVLAQKIADQAESMADAVLQINKDIASIQDQIDGNITTWFDSHIPTSANAPAKDWTTDELKNQHLGDLFYVDNADLEENGYCYRWQQTNGVYGWVLLEDAGVTKALAAAAAAQDTADGKRRVFISTPVPPYDAGDLWVQGSGGDIMRCATAKSKGQSYASADWVKASKYTDDTAANKAQSAANNAQSTANGAQSAAEEAQGTADAASNYANEALDIANAALSRADFQRVVRTKPDGLHIGDNITDYEVLIDSASVNVVAAGVRVSTFSDKFIRLDNMQIRKVRGGLAISVYKG